MAFNPAQQARTRQSPFAHNAPRPGGVQPPTPLGVTPPAAPAPANFDFDNWGEDSPRAASGGFGNVQAAGGGGFPPSAQSAFPGAQQRPPMPMGGAQGGFGGGGVQPPGMGQQQQGMQQQGFQQQGIQQPQQGIQQPGYQQPGYQQQGQQQPMGNQGAQNDMDEMKKAAAQAATQAMTDAGINPLAAEAGKMALASAMNSEQMQQAKGFLGRFFPDVNVRSYFQVTHSYVLEKFRFLLFPFIYIHPSQTMSEDMGRCDFYVPLMGYITYVLVYSLNMGVHQKFTPHIFSSAATFAAVLFSMEIFGGYIAFLLVGSSNITVLDLAAYCGYKFVPLVVWLLICLTGFADGFLYYPFISYFCACASLGLFLLLNKIPAKQGQSNYGDSGNTIMHKNVIFALTGLQVFFCWILSPSLARLQEASILAAASHKAAGRGGGSGDDSN